MFKDTHTKFAEEQDKGRKKDCVKSFLEIQESDTRCTLVSFCVLSRADEL